MNTNTTTHNGAPAFEHSENLYLEFFSKAGSAFTKAKPFYNGSHSALELFKDAWRADNKVLCMQLLMWLRDIRGGAGNRSGSREIYTWLASNYPEWMTANINMIPQYGRYDDLCALYGTPCEAVALECWKNALEDPNTSGLAAKWANRKDNIFRKYLKMDPKSFRKMLVAKTDVVESLMCNKQWGYIDYSKVPSVAATRYNNAFVKNDSTRYAEWKASLSDPKTNTKVNTGAIYPHDLCRMFKADECGVDNSLLDSMLESMPNYIPKGQRIMPICDFSASMGVSTNSGSITAMDVSLSLGLYCSDKVGKDNPFYRKLIPFSTTAKLENWKGMSVSRAMREVPDGYVGSTNIYSAFTCILDAAKFFNATNDQMPTMLLILSDMQFDEASSTDTSAISQCIKTWEDAGYTAPKIVFWNLAPYNNQPATVFDKDVCMVSGFSPSILEAILSGEGIDPMKILYRAIGKYKVNVPS